MAKRIIAIWLLATVGLYAQNTGEDELGAWYMYFGMNRISERFSIHTEAQFRFYETTDSFNQLLLRTGLNYHINPNAIVTGGYAFIDTDPTFESDEILINNISEHRIFQQFIMTNKVWELLFEHRYRLEQRFITIENENSPFFERNTEHRARYRLQVMLPLTDTFFLNFYDEIFINLQNSIFDQNRLYFAGGVHVTENASLQVGFLKNHFNNRNFDRLQIGFFYNPDLRGIFKKKAKDDG
ncbi:DUF2490 domain-containing protein [Allomuricauda sp. SCSIO 65647]|uniref:DUF2490 domain-containing protein n=1 Tax=Allomuricauda sp. SCSIO 65647 TaxID=2908843 RepID=UPI001F3596DE|nr:DUF2490 domain-containing protein [Muricauda sp. SCSIO 65647]UJH67744.1 DUF2490 domain-containing protein [Muricauda sp. SCSIO 65647]